MAIRRGLSLSRAWKRRGFLRPGNVLGYLNQAPVPLSAAEDELSLVAEASGGARRAKAHALYAQQAAEKARAFYKRLGSGGVGWGGGWVGWGGVGWGGVGWGGGLGGLGRVGRGWVGRWGGDVAVGGIVGGRGKVFHKRGGWVGWVG